MQAQCPETDQRDHSVDKSSGYSPGTHGKGGERSAVWLWLCQRAVHSGHKQHHLESEVVRQTVREKGLFAHSCRLNCIFYSRFQNCFYIKLLGYFNRLCIFSAPREVQLNCTAWTGVHLDFSTVLSVTIKDWDDYVNSKYNSYVNWIARKQKVKRFKAFKITQITTCFGLSVN